MSRLFLPILFALPVMAQTPEPDRKTLDTLITEVHQLRTAIERSTLLGTRTQIALERLQIEDARHARLTEDLKRARQAVFDLQGEHDRIEARIKSQEDRLARSNDPNERTALTDDIKALKVELERLAAAQVQSHASEGELLSQVQTSQRGVAEIQDRIAEMERALEAAIRQMTAQ